MNKRNELVILVAGQEFKRMRPDGYNLSANPRRSGWHYHKPKNLRIQRHTTLKQ